MPGPVLCPDCAANLPFIDALDACPRCGAPYGRTLCTECPMPGSEEALACHEAGFPFSAARCALSFEGATQRIVRTYKDGDELQLDVVIASFICAAIRGRTMRRDLAGSTGVDDWSAWADALVYVPASPEAVLRRGFDHMERIAEICSARTGIRLEGALESRKGTLDQRDLDRGGRIANRRNSFALSSGDMHILANVILIDDVFTTGATLSAATEILLAGGADEVRVVTLARVW